MSRKLYFIIFVVILFSGCSSSPYFREGVFNEQGLQTEYVKSLVKPSTDIFTFIDSVYAVKTEKYSEHIVLVEPWEYTQNYLRNRQDVDISNYNSPKVYGVYCSAKGGMLYYWKRYSDEYNFDKLFVCEIDGKVDSASVYRIIQEGSLDSQFPFRIKTMFVTKNWFEDYLKNTKTETFVSDNNELLLKYLYSDSSGRNQYSARITFENKAKTPMEINLLNSKIIVNGAEYSVDYKRSYDNKRVEWKHYNHLDLFVRDDTFTKMKLNPGEVFSAGITFMVPGLKENDFKDMIFMFDNIKFSGFQVKTYYEIDRLLKKEQ